MSIIVKYVNLFYMPLMCLFVAFIFSGEKNIRNDIFKGEEY